MIKQTIFLLTLLALVLNANKPYHKTVHVTDAYAKCLDGSPAALYLSEGDPEHIMMYFMGGASCGYSSLPGTL